MGDFHIDSFSIVVAADNHNPTILNPDFLIRTKMASEDWELREQDPPISTPAFSRVSYKRGLTIVADMDKLIFTGNAKVVKDELSTLVDLVSSYLNTLPHVNYRAVGLNPSARRDLGSSGGTANQFFERVFKDGPWMQLDSLEAKPRVKFVFKTDSGQISVNVAETGSDSEQSSDVLKFSANYHHELSRNDPGEALKKALEIIQGSRKTLDNFNQYIERFFE